MMALYEIENDTRWSLDLIAGDWHHNNPPAPAQSVAPSGGGGLEAPQQQPTDKIRAKIAALEA